MPPFFSGVNEGPVIPASLPSLSAPLPLENRSCTITVGSKVIENIGLQQGLDVWFSVHRSLLPKSPNTCDLRLYNLSADSRKKIESSSTGTVAAIHSKKGATTAASSPVVPVIIEAGYIGGTSIIFNGQMRSAQTVQDGADTVTELETGDGDEATLIARSTTSFGTGTNAYTVAVQLLSDMGIGQGNLATVATALKAAPMFAAGIVLKGSSLDHIVDLAAGCGLEFTIQNSVAQWTQLGAALGGPAYRLASTPVNTGLIGSPSVDTKGVLHLECLMIPGLKPGSLIQVQSEFVPNQAYRIITIETTGDTAGGDWQHTIEAKPLGTGIR